MKRNNWIMIVDDNPIDQKITLQVLKSNKLLSNEVLVFDNAKAALAQLIANLEEEGNMPKYILLDLDMPEMSGLDFLAEFAKFSPMLKNTCKIVVVTASKVTKDLALVQVHPDVVKLIPKPLHCQSLAFIA